MYKQTKNGTRYIAAFHVPKSIGDGRVLCHNHVIHTTITHCGERGFRAWTARRRPPDFVKCPCGWSGLPHYAHQDHVAATGGKAATQEQIDAIE